MHNLPLIRLFVAVLSVLIAVPAVMTGQSKPQKAEPPRGSGKINTRETLQTEQERLKADAERKLVEEEKKAVVEEGVERVETSVVNVDTVVYNKKTGRIVTGLTRPNFAIFENGVRQDISNFATPDSPITVSLVLEYSRWTDILGSAAGGRFEPGVYEAVRPVAYFLSKFIKPPNDHASVIAFDMRPTPITDFTNDPERLRQTVDLLLRNSPSFRENNLWDALKFALVGGTGDSVVLENSKDDRSDYGGMANVRSKRRAIILVASGIDTFSKTNYDEVRRIIQEAGIPIYIISTGNLFFKRYEHLLPATDDLTGGPGRLTFLQAQNAMNTLAKESGGAHYPMTFEGEIPSYLENINGFLRNQYSLGYDLKGKHEAGKRYKLEVKVDVDGDGVFEGKDFVVQHRPYYRTPNAPKKK